MAGKEDGCYNRKEPLAHTCRRLSLQEAKGGGGFEGCGKKSTTQNGTARLKIISL